jgi:DNA-binding protein
VRLVLHCAEKYKKLASWYSPLCITVDVISKLRGQSMTEEKQKKQTSEKSAKTTKTTQANKNVVFIGKKPVMNYVVALMTFFNSGAKKAVIKARGRAISKAVDTVELSRRAFVKDLQLQSVAISTEEVTRSEGQKAKVSAIEITVSRA